MDDSSVCEYCKEPFFDDGQIYSIPLNAQGTLYSGMYCSRQCRLGANQYVADEVTRSLTEWEKRDAYMRAQDLHQIGQYVISAPHPSQLRGMRRRDWMLGGNHTRLKGAIF